MRQYILVFVLLTAAGANAVPRVVSWRAAADKPTAQVIDARQGETLYIEPVISSYGTPVDVTHATLTLWWQTNNMGAAWWSKPAVTGSAPGSVRAVWSPTNDVGAAQYLFYVQATSADGASYPAYGVLRLGTSPGYSPAAAPPAQYQWITPEELLAVSNALASAIADATNHLIRTYLLTSNSWMVVSNDTLTIYAPVVSGAAASVVWQSGGAGIDPDATNILWQALASGLASKAPKAWGQYAPDGTLNPDPDYMVFVNSPALVYAGGYQWASSGAFSVLCSTGAVAYISGEDGEARWGLDLVNNYVGFVRGGSVTVGAIASSFTPQWGGSPSGTVAIAYAYESGDDFPSLWFTPALSLPFDAVDGVWVDNADGTATVTAAATTSRGFWQATTSRSIASTFVAKPPARFDGGIFGNTNSPPVVFDSTITVTSGGKTYRIPAQEIP